MNWEEKDLEAYKQNHPELFGQAMEYQSRLFRTNLNKGGWLVAPDRGRK